MFDEEKNIKKSQLWDSNPPPADYKSAALPNELSRLKLRKNGECRIRTYEVVQQQIYSLIPLATRETPQISFYYQNMITEQ
jgi:hypothetical protein